MAKMWRIGWDGRPPVKLVTNGPFLLVRHPIYLGTWLFGLGFEIALGNWLVFAVICGAPILYLIAAREERLLEKVFPEQWTLYASRTKRFIPYIW